MSKMIQLALITITIQCARSHVVWETPDNLQPVHGLYVKPSIDGTTGDLYVAATEESGSNSQWLTDQPINFLSAASETEATTVPLTETVTTQKRAVLTAPPLQFTYALPPGSEGSTVPYTAPSATSEEPKLPQCASSAPHYSPFQYFYPQMMSAIANAFNAYKPTTEEDKTTNLAAQTAVWPYTYAYPFQYVMVDPSAWTGQITTAATPSESTGKMAS